MAKIESIDRQQPDAAEMLPLTIDSSRTLGAISAIGRLGTGLAAQAFQEFEAWLAEKRYRELGFATEVDFLSSPLSPISKNRYFDRKQLLEKEGAQTFDLLNSLRVPISVRKLLSDGSVRVDENIIEIGEEKVDITDRARVTELLQTLASTNSKQARIIDRGKKEVESRKRENSELKEQIASGASVSSDSTPYARALVSVLGGYQLLSAEVASISDQGERVRFGSVALEHIAEAKLQLEAALGFDAPTNSLGLSAQDEAELLAATE